MKRRTPPIEHEPHVPAFDPGDVRVPLDDDGVDLVYAATADPAALDRVAEILDRLFDDVPSVRRRTG